MKFSFATSSSIHFGEGIINAIPGLLPRGLKKVLIVTGGTPFRYQATLDLLEQNGYALSHYSQTGEPTLQSIATGLSVARREKVELVIAIGGGSVIDAGKAIAAMLNNEGDLIDYLEVVGKGQPLRFAPAPMMAVPTTAGTGSEVTFNSVIGVPDAKVKVSLRSSQMVPRWAVVDPELTYHLPVELSAYTGMDALIQCVEAYLSKNANPISDAFAKQGIEHASRSLRSACSKTLDRSAKNDMCIASVCGGIALANAKLGSVHGFAGPIGGMINAPHGALCASLFQQCFKMNLQALKQRDPKNSSLDKIDEVARLLTGNPSASGTYALAWIESLIGDLPLLRLGALGFKKADIESAVSKSALSSSMKGNPIELNRDELTEILESSL